MNVARQLETCSRASLSASEARAARTVGGGEQHRFVGGGDNTGQRPPQPLAAGGAASAPAVAAAGAPEPAEGADAAGVGDDVLAGPGENAGVVRIGDGLAVAFKLESHNHPSAVEPYQGAATGVGGILRDIVAMGARPVALLDAAR